ncbi:NAD-dependent epimerase/dehydratase family protein [Micrococcales bacterium 31B]|nr:NAD-dependent epimerase/dehydratase family protein [Micrococcales bacterium 31B]
MQTILGSTGQIATELARELYRSHTQDLRLVSRNPQRIHDTDQLVSANLLDASQTTTAVMGSDVVYFAAGLPANTELWERQFPTMLRNALAATRAAGAKFVYFDNTYMYPQDDRVQTETTQFAPVGRKGAVRAAMANAVLAEMSRGYIDLVIGRAPEFYGPGRTQSFTHALILDRLRSGRRPLAPVRDDVRRTLIWTPDASRALATLGNTPDAFGQTWHLPVHSERPTYREFIHRAATVFGTSPRYTVMPSWLLWAAGLASADAREIRELLPRYAQENLFTSAKFEARFPEFAITDYRTGLAKLAA